MKRTALALVLLLPHAAVAADLDFTVDTIRSAYNGAITYVVGTVTNSGKNGFGTISMECTGKLNNRPTDVSWGYIRNLQPGQTAGFEVLFDGRIDSASCRIDRAN